MKKILLIILCLTSILFLCAWAEQAVILSTDDKLIDLSKAIEFVKPGGEALEESDEAADEKPTSGEPDNSGNAQTVIVISVRNEAVTYNGNSLGGRSIEELLRRDNKENVRFCLVDDFAEAHVYKAILKQLELLHTEIGLEFSYE